MSSSAPTTVAPPPRRYTVALIVDRLGAEYTVHLRRAVERAATARGVSVLVVTGQPLRAQDAAEATQNQIYDLISSRSVDGVLISTTVGHVCGPDGLVALARAFAPLPVCSIGVPLPGFPSLIVDNSVGMQQGVRHLISEHKCRRIAFIAGATNSTEAQERFDGYRAALDEAGLEFDSDLVQRGDFMVDSGMGCMQNLLSGGADFDAVVAANDGMALGALDTLADAGLMVPRDVLVCGFDDISSAHFARPSLSTLRQPMWWLGESAIECILDQLAGKEVPLLQTGAVEFVRRESCGCGYHVAATLPSSSSVYPRVVDVIRDRQGDLMELVRKAATIPRDALGDWPAALFEALARELEGDEGRFSDVFEGILELAQAEGASLDEFQRVVSVMRSEFRTVRVKEREDMRVLERIWHNARVLVGAASIRLLGRQKLEQEQVSLWLSWVGERLATTLSLSLLKEQLITSLPKVHILRGTVSLYTSPGSRTLKPLVSLANGEPILSQNDEPFPDALLAPEAMFSKEETRHFVVVPITFETQMLGVAVFESGTLASVYETLRQQIGAAVKGAILHREMVAQVTLRERMEAEKASEETRLAARIQTSVQPHALMVPGLEIAALSETAAETGGDYYDVLPAPEGAWLAIGDVTGHGLASGLVMLMVQSMVSALCRQELELHPSDIISAVGDAIWDNVRKRLQRDDHATLTVLRYREDGTLEFAGAHEDLIVLRKDTGKCEQISTPGFWVGAVPSVRRMTEDNTLKLNPGDLLVMYTDGITEARNAHQQQYSLERLIACIESCGPDAPHKVRDAVRESVRSWTASVDDDMTLLVTRYVGQEKRHAL